MKNQDCYVSAGLAGWLGYFSAPSWICREQTLVNAFLKRMALALGRVRSTSRLRYFARHFAVMLKRIVAVSARTKFEGL